MTSENDFDKEADEEQKIMLNALNDKNMTDTFYCFFRRKTNWDKIDNVKIFIDNYQEKFCDDYIIGIEKDDKEIKSAWFKNPTAKFINELKTEFNIELSRCDHTKPDWLIEFQ